MIRWSREVLALSLLAASWLCSANDFDTRCNALAGRDGSGITIVVDDAILRVVSIDGERITTIGTAFYVGDFIDEDNSTNVAFLTAAHVIDEAKKRNKPWGLIPCGSDKAEDVVRDVQVIFEPFSKSISDISAISLKKTEDAFFDALGARPITISAMLVGSRSLLGESAWWSGYSRLHDPRLPPTYNRHEWRSIPIETRYSLFSVSSGITPSGGASGSPVLRKTPSGGLEVIGVVALTPATAEEEIDEIILRVGRDYPDIDRSIAHDMANANVAASPLSPSHPALFYAIGESQCKKSLIDAIQRRDVPALSTRSKNCFGGTQPAVAAFRFLLWLKHDASMEDKKFLLTNRSSLQRAFERLGSNALVEMFTTALSKAEAEGAGYAARLSSIEYARSILGSVGLDSGKDFDVELSALRTLETELYSAISSSGLLSESGKRTVYSGLVDAYIWRRKRSQKWSLLAQTESPQYETVNLLCAAELAPERALAWDSVADLFRTNGETHIAASAFAIKARLSDEVAIRNAALKQCRALSQGDHSACQLRTPESLANATEVVLRRLSAVSGINEPSDSNLSSCVSAVAPLREAKHRELAGALRYADLTLTKTGAPGTNGNVDQQDADTVTSGTTTSYSIVVSNGGPDAADGAVLADPAPTGLTCTTARCSSSGGAQCPVETGANLVAALQSSGAAIPRLPADGSIEVILTCTVN